MEKLKATLCVVILSKNEQGRILKCLQSISWADHIVIVDNGSTDNTLQVAKKYHPRIIQSNSQDFSELRTIGRNAAHDDWLLYVDADEQITEELHKEITKTINTFDREHCPHSYYIKRKNYYLGHEWPYRDQLLRLFWRTSLIGWVGKLHESATVEGPSGILIEPLVHDTHRTLEEMVDKTNIWSQVEAELRLKARHPAVLSWRLFRVMITSFLDSYVRQKGWKAGSIGLTESIYQAYSMFITYAKLWELQHKGIKQVS